MCDVLGHGLKLSGTVCEVLGRYVSFFGQCVKFLIQYERNWDNM